MASHTPKGRRARDAIVAAAEPLLARHGFHGTSVRDVADAAGVPLATVVYHFARKERLYAAVLAAIADELMAALAGVTSAAGLADLLVAWTARAPERARLLVRELLDNPSRVARAAQLPLGPFLLAAARLVGGAQPELAVLHAVGGLSYAYLARPTVDRIVGAPRARELAESFTSEATAFARQTLEVSHGTVAAAPARPPRARSRRASNHRHARQRRADDAAGRRVSRRRGDRVSHASARGRARVTARAAG
jgi:AcrR family transcriptional regulator